MARSIKRRFYPVRIYRTVQEPTGNLTKTQGGRQNKPRIYNNNASPAVSLRDIFTFKSLVASMLKIRKVWHIWQICEVCYSQDTILLRKVCIHTIQRVLLLCQRCISLWIALPTEDCRFPCHGVACFQREESAESTPTIKRAVECSSPCVVIFRK